MTEPSKLKERRQRAREAGEDVDPEESQYTWRSLEAAIEAATRVKIDDDIVTIHRLAWLHAYNERLTPMCEQHATENCPMHFNIIDVQKDALVMTLMELGFEVEVS